MGTTPDHWKKKSASLTGKRWYMYRIAKLSSFIYKTAVSSFLSALLFMDSIRCCEHTYGYSPNLFADLFDLVGSI